MVKPKKASTSGAVAHAVVTKPKGNTNRRSSSNNNNQLVPSLLRKTKGGNGFGANRLKMPFGGQYNRTVTTKTVATAVPGQSFPVTSHYITDELPIVQGSDANDIPPPFTSLTVRDDSIQISDLTDPPMLMNQQQLLPVLAARQLPGNL